MYAAVSCSIYPEIRKKILLSLLKQHFFIETTQKVYTEFTETKQC